MLRHTAAIALAAALLTLTACSSDDQADDKPSPTPSVDMSKAEKGAGIPPEPTGAKRTALLAALKAIDPQLVADEDKAISNARNQCHALSNGGQRPDYFAAQRFGSGTHTVSEADGRRINAALRKTLCP